MTVAPEKIERRRAQGRARYHANPEPYRASNKKYREKNKDRMQEWKHRWRITNTERLRELNQASHIRTRQMTPWVTLIRNAKHRARLRGVEFALSLTWAKNRYTGHCELTGIKFLVEIGRRGPGPFACSIDRVDQSRGYVEDNCRFVLFCVNVLRGSMNDEQMMFVARHLVGRTP